MSVHEQTWECGFDEPKSLELDKYVCTCGWVDYEPSQAEKDRKDAERYRRLRENWIDCDELDLHGRLAVIDATIDVLRTTEPLLVAPPLTMSKATSTLKASLNQCADDYDLTSNDTRRGD